jgi:hypothetical protein
MRRAGCVGRHGGALPLPAAGSTRAPGWLATRSTSPPPQPSPPQPSPPLPAAPRST